MSEPEPPDDEPPGPWHGLFDAIARIMSGRDDD